MDMKKILTIIIGAMLLSSCAVLQNLNSTRVLSSLVTATQAVTLTDAQVQGYVGQYIQQLDAKSEVCSPTSRYTTRLMKLVKGLDSVDGTPLNFKVYKNNEVRSCRQGATIQEVKHHIGAFCQKYRKKLSDVDVCITTWRDEKGRVRYMPSYHFANKEDAENFAKTQKNATIINNDDGRQA